jgi:hypothetical protein
LVRFDVKNGFLSLAKNHQLDHKTVKILKLKSIYYLLILKPPL